MNSLTRLPRSLYWLSGAFVLLVLLVAAGVHRSADRAVAALLWQDIPCWARTVSDRASTVFAAELSLIYALILGVVCLRARKPFAAGWIVFLLLAGVGVEISFKYYFTHPSPSAFLETLPRVPCGVPGVSYPFTVVPTPSTLPSGYSIRAAYFFVLLAAVIGGRWPKLRIVSLLGLGALAVVAGASRVTVGWHWPTDVLAGLLLGAAAAVLATSMADNFVWLRAGGGRSGGKSAGPARRAAPRRKAKTKTRSG